MMCMRCHGTCLVNARVGEQALEEMIQYGSKTLESNVLVQNILEVVSSLWSSYKPLNAGIHFRSRVRDRENGGSSEGQPCHSFHGRVQHLGSNSDLLAGHVAPVSE